MTTIGSHRKSSCCANFFRMCRYRKIVTQQEQYEFNMRKINEWKLRNDFDEVNLPHQSDKLSQLNPEDNLLMIQMLDSREAALQRLENASLQDTIAFTSEGIRTAHTSDTLPQTMQSLGIMMNGSVQGSGRDNDLLQQTTKALNAVQKDVGMSTIEEEDTMIFQSSICGDSRQN